ncbi:serine protease inhibitor Kazal-type 6 isoform X2 [Alligator mississippiensis]|uniref:serine protease inhibitor Kazal-type 6 isoform X2 n=1 Tax=Alligator mississippiensis TaxID=8496 RepID=UPI002877E700|nr:serine protease inhibitor Kazal-type 6 isoform X2 [Alligator mississippiensis]
MHRGVPAPPAFPEGESDVAGKEEDKGSGGLRCPLRRREGGSAVTAVAAEMPDCSEFKDSGTFCTRESNPHCGDDGMTYGNLCAFCKAVEKSGGKLRLYHMGKC